MASELNDNLDLTESEGWLTVTVGGVVEYDGPNAFAAAAEQIVATLLGGTSANAIDTLSVYIAAVLQANGTSFTVTYPSANQVKFAAHFDAASFNGTFDELRLTSAAGGTFSTKTGLSITKTSAQTMDVEWLLTINI